MDHITTTIRNILANLDNNSGVAQCEHGFFTEGIVNFSNNNNKRRWNLNKIQKGTTISGNADLRKAWNIYNKNTASRWNLPR